jgi:acyl carrier protein
MNNNPEIDKAIATIEQIVGMNPGEIQGDESLHQINWDSMAVISFIAAADSEFGKTINATKIKECNSVRDLLSLLEI